MLADARIGQAFLGSPRSPRKAKPTPQRQSEAKARGRGPPVRASGGVGIDLGCCLPSSAGAPGVYLFACPSDMLAHIARHKISPARRVNLVLTCSSVAERFPMVRLLTLLR